MAKLVAKALKCGRHMTALKLAAKCPDDMEVRDDKIMCKHCGCLVHLATIPHSTFNGEQRRTTKNNEESPKKAFAKNQWETLVCAMFLRTPCT